MATAEPKIGDVVGEKYELDALLGRGGMGAVYRARHRITDRIVALKWLLEDDPKRRARFLREAKAMGRLSHPNVIGVLDVGDHEGAIFLVMDYLEGKSLRDVMDGHAFDPAEAISLLMPALGGVHAAHQAGILHRDLKPENLFVLCDEQGAPYDTKVLDFGVAKPVHDDAGALASLTHSGVIVGTPRYMAPEQLGDEAELDARADVYALGVILYELLLGRLPYKAKSLNALFLEIMTGSIESPKVAREELPEGLCDAVMKALARDAEDRWPDVRAFAQALEPWGDGARFEAPRRVNTPKSPAVRPVVRVRSDDNATVEPLRTTSPARPAVLETPQSAPPPRDEDARASRKIAWVAGLGVAAALALALVWIAVSAEQEPAIELAEPAPLPAPAPSPPEREIAPPQPEPAIVERTAPPPVIPTASVESPPVEHADRPPRAQRSRPRQEAPAPTADEAPEPSVIETRAGTISREDF